MREALAASRVDHRNVVHVIDFGVTNDGTPYLVMEYLRGRDLGVLLKKAKTPLAVEYVADVMLGVCAALRACHQLGIVHRDLKPSNIFLADTDTGPEIKVLDFGVSKAPTAIDLTQEGQILGTPQYLSPEQVNGKVGPESDQYALGVLLYVCLTKKLPFEDHQNLTLLRAIEAGRFQSPRVHRPEIPLPLEAIVLRAMHVNPTERFDSVHALGQALWTFASSRGQVEWKNYYFDTPPTPAFGQETLRGIPHAPLPGTSGVSLADGVPVARAVEPTAILPVDPTAILPGSVNLAPEISAAAGPQLFVSTKLAKPTRPTSPETPTPAEEPVEGGSWRRWTLFGVAAAVIPVGLGIGYRHHGAATAVTASSVVTVSKLSPATASPVVTISKLLPATASPVVRERAPAPHPPAQAPLATKRPKAQRTTRSVRQISAPQAAQSPRLTGLDKNGIGIPSN
jgi:serine/threonine-protein kinase